LAEKSALAAIDAVALFEGGLARLCDATVAVCAPFETRVERLMQHDGITREYAQNRINAQKSEDWFREMCGYTLYNDGTRKEFREKCAEFLAGLQK
jgi:dephospho-CoA kinase